MNGTNTGTVNGLGKGVVVGSRPGFDVALLVGENTVGFTSGLAAGFVDDGVWNVGFNAGLDVGLFKGAFGYNLLGADRAGCVKGLLIGINTGTGVTSLLGAETAGCLATGIVTGGSLTTGFDGVLLCGGEIMGLAIGSEAGGVITGFVVVVALLGAEGSETGFFTTGLDGPKKTG